MANKYHVRLSEDERLIEVYQTRKAKGCTVQEAQSTSLASMLMIP